MCFVLLINVTINYFPLNLITFSTNWIQELPCKPHKKHKNKCRNPKYYTWNASRNHIKALSSVYDMLLKYCKFEHRVHMDA